MQDRQLLAEYGLSLCDSNCPCGDVSYLVFTDVGKDRDPRLPAWINGSTLDEAKTWIAQQKKDATHG